LQVSLRQAVDAFRGATGYVPQFSIFGYDQNLLSYGIYNENARGIHLTSRLIDPSGVVIFIIFIVIIIIFTK